MDASSPFTSPLFPSATSLPPLFPRSHIVAQNSRPFFYYTFSIHFSNTKTSDFQNLISVFLERNFSSDFIKLFFFYKILKNERKLRPAICMRMRVYICRDACRKQMNETFASPDWSRAVARAGAAWKLELLVILRFNLTLAVAFSRPVDLALYDSAAMLCTSVNPLASPMDMKCWDRVERKSEASEDH